MGCDHFINVLNDDKPILGFFTKERTFHPTFLFPQMQLTKFRKLRIVLTKEKNLISADMLSRSFTQTELN